MTDLLYLTQDDTSLAQAKVLDCFVYGDDYGIELDQSLFHPQGGGQKSDSGKIGEQVIHKVVMDQGRLLHLSHSSLDRGEYPVTIDSDVRDLNTRLHSAGHLIAHFICLSGLVPVKAHHWPGESFVSFEAKKSGTQFPCYSVEQLTLDVNAVVQSSLPRVMSYTDDGRRNITFGDYAPFLCGGTHVNELSKIGAINITGIKLKKGKLKVSYSVA